MDDPPVHTIPNHQPTNMDVPPVHTIPNHQPTNMDVLPRTFVKIILAAKGLVRHSSIRPPNNRDDLCLLLCLYPSSNSQTLSFQDR